MAWGDHHLVNPLLLYFKHPHISLPIHFLQLAVEKIQKDKYKDNDKYKYNENNNDGDNDILQTTSHFSSHPPSTTGCRVKFRMTINIKLQFHENSSFDSTTQIGTYR